MYTFLRASFHDKFLTQNLKLNPRSLIIETWDSSLKVSRIENRVSQATVNLLLSSTVIASSLGETKFVKANAYLVDETYDPIFIARHFFYITH